MLKKFDKYSECIEFMKDPDEQSVYLEHFKGNIIIQSIPFKFILDENNNEEDIIIKSIVEPKLTLKTLDKLGHTVYNFIKNVVSLKNGIHQYSKNFAFNFLNENNLMFNMFFLAKQLNKNVWCKSDYIFEYKSLEIIYWLAYNDIARSKK